jgi:hypothetical protein
MKCSVEHETQNARMVVEAQTRDGGYSARRVITVDVQIRAKRFLGRSSRNLAMLC